MSLRKTLLLCTLSQFLLAAAFVSALTGQSPGNPPPSSQTGDAFGSEGPSVNWQVEIERNTEALQKQSEKFNAQLSRLIDLRAEGEVTIGQFVEMIQEAQGKERLNVLIAEELRDLTVTSFEINRVRVSSAFQMLPLLTGKETVLVKIESAAENESADLISIVKDPTFTEDIGVRTHPVKRVLANIKPEVLLQSLERGIEFADVGTPRVQIALEPETGLLFVKGTSAQLDLINEILTAIQVNNIPVIDLNGMGPGSGGLGGQGGGLGGGGGGLGGQGGGLDGQGGGLGGGGGGLGGAGGGLGGAGGGLGGAGGGYGAPDNSAPGGSGGK